MKTFHIILIFISSTTFALAGGPSAEMKGALVEAIELTPTGWSAVVTGPIHISTVDAENPKSPTRNTTKLYAQRARIKMLGGNHEYDVRDEKRYEKRLRGYVGTKVFIQMWGTVTTLDGDVVVEITAGQISLFRPTREEAAFELRNINVQEK